MDTMNDLDTTDRMVLVPNVESKGDVDDITRAESCKPPQAKISTIKRVDLCQQVKKEVYAYGYNSAHVERQEPIDSTMLATYPQGCNTSKKYDFIAGFMIGDYPAANSTFTDVIDVTVKGETSLDSLQVETSQSVSGGNMQIIAPSHEPRSVSVDVGTSSEEIPPTRTDNQETSDQLARGNWPRKRGRKKREFKCSICKKSFHENHQLNTHMTTIHSLTCYICVKSFKHAIRYEGHQREHAGDSNPYWCNKCDKKFPSYQRLKPHKTSHRLDANCECTICWKVFNRIDNFRSHQLLHTNPDINRCTVCGIQFASRSYLNKHKAVHQDKKPFECVVCDLGFNFKPLLDRHMRVHTGQPLITACKSAVPCDVCGDVFMTQKILDHHMNIHTGIKPYSCQICDKRFAKVSSRRKHETRHTTSPQHLPLIESDMQLAFDCTFCSNSFAAKNFLDDHVTKAHTGGERFSCEICGRTFSSIPCMKRHQQKMHSKSRSVDPEAAGASGGSVPKRVKCHVCGTNVKDLSCHLIDLRKLKYVCRVCGSKFGYSQQLKRHFFSHSGKKFHVCRICGRQFVNSSKMTVHEATHVSRATTNKIVPCRRVRAPREKKHKCETCGKMYRDIYNLKRHDLKHMRDTVRRGTTF